MLALPTRVMGPFLFHILSKTYACVLYNYTRAHTDMVARNRFGFGCQIYSLLDIVNIAHLVGGRDSLLILNENSVFRSRFTG